MRSLELGLYLLASIAIAVATGLYALKADSEPTPPPARSPNTECPRLYPAEEALAGATLGRFVRYAVQRRDPAQTFDLVTPRFRQGFSRAKWASGNIPVVPYNATGPVRVNAEFSELCRDRIILRASLLAVNASAPRTYFDVWMVRRAGKWLVDYWMPSYRQGPARGNPSA